jgi:hypothetical protein
MTPTPTFVLKVQPLPGVDPIKALRWLLKSALRQHGLIRCVLAREETPAQDSGVTKSNTS